MLNEGVKVADYVSSLGSEQTLFNWNNMTKVTLILFIELNLTLISRLNEKQRSLAVKFLA